MGSLVCTHCGICYPPGRVAPCAVCDGDLEKQPIMPDPEWRKRVEALLAAQVAARDEGDLGRVLAWRLGSLIEAGYTVAHAEVLAAARDIDLHRACALLANGCPEQTAWAILS